MPTEFSKCDECHYTNVMPITHKINSVYYADQQKANIIMEIKNVPFKIAARIVQFTHEYHKCGYTFVRTSLSARNGKWNGLYS